MNKPSTASQESLQNPEQAHAASVAHGQRGLILLLARAIAEKWLAVHTPKPGIADGLWERIQSGVA